MSWQIILAAWFALQLPLGAIVGRILKQSSFAAFPHGETDATTAIPPRSGLVASDNFARLI